jgi:hypothetical protein
VAKNPAPRASYVEFNQAVYSLLRLHFDIPT